MLLMFALLILASGHPLNFLGGWDTARSAQGLLVALCTGFTPGEHMEWIEPGTALCKANNLPSLLYFILVSLSSIYTHLYMYTFIFLIKFTNSTASRQLSCLEYNQTGYNPWHQIWLSYSTRSVPWAQA